jgi:hypothetical protein
VFATKDSTHALIAHAFFFKDFRKSVAAIRIVNASSSVFRPVFCLRELLFVCINLGSKLFSSEMKILGGAVVDEDCKYLIGCRLGDRVQTNQSF